MRRAERFSVGSIPSTSLDAIRLPQPPDTDHRPQWDFTESQPPIAAKLGSPQGHHSEALDHALEALRLYRLAG